MGQLGRTRSQLWWLEEEALAIKRTSSYKTRTI